MLFHWIETTPLDVYKGFTQMEGWRLDFDPSSVTKSNEPRKCMISIPKEVLDAEQV
jgi:hypothetical protein